MSSEKPKEVVYIEAKHLCSSCMLSSGCDIRIKTEQLRMQAMFHRRDLWIWIVKCEMAILH